MIPDEDELLMTGLGQVGGSGAARTARRLPKNVYEIDKTFAAPLHEIVARVAPADQLTCQPSISSPVMASTPKREFSSLVSRSHAGRGQAAADHVVTDWHLCDAPAHACRVLGFDQGSVGSQTG